MDKRAEHLELQRLVNEWVKNGGVINQIPEGVRGKCLSRKEPEPKINPLKQLPSGARCKICDWSPTDNRSVCNPEIAEYGGNRLEIDELTGDMLCRLCLAASAQMNRKFKREENVDHGLSNYLVNDALEEIDGQMLTDDGPGEGWRPVYDPVLGQIIPGAYRKGKAEQQSS